MSRIAFRRAAPCIAAAALLAALAGAAGLLIGSAGWLVVSLALSGPLGFAALVQLIAGSYTSQATSSIGIPSLVSSASDSGEAGIPGCGIPRVGRDGVTPLAT
jgi:hypothetical protein